MSINIIEIVENAKIQARQKNIDEVRNSINDNWVNEKINNYIERWGLDSSYVEQIKNEILTNFYVATCFAKDPGKQNISENIIIDLIGSKKMPASGKNCVRFDKDGTITSKATAGVSKSVDCMYLDYYATQKYTMEEGGAQDNQFADVVLFLENGSIKNKVAAILDGGYWDNGRREQLVEHFKNNNNVLITSAQEIVNK